MGFYWEIDGYTLWLCLLGCRRIETRVVFCITGFVSCCWDLSSHVPQPFACSFFCVFPYICIMLCQQDQFHLLTQKKFICFQVKMWHRKIINLDFQNWGCSCKDIIVSTICMTRKCLACGKAGHRLESWRVSVCKWTWTLLPHPTPP